MSREEKKKRPYDIGKTQTLCFTEYRDSGIGSREKGITNNSLPQYRRLSSFHSKIYVINQNKMKILHTLAIDMGRSTCYIDP